MNTKTCTKCKDPKDLSEFHKRAASLDGRAFVCKTCRSEYVKRYREINPTARREYHRNWHRNLAKADPDKYKNIQLVRLYGITIEDYKKMLEDQGKKCGICLVHQDELKKAMYVDHCHRTGRIRGLLCGKCNSMIGLANDEADLLQKAVSYLEKQH